MDDMQEIITISQLIEEIASLSLSQAEELGQIVSAVKLKEV